jgi:hypothetical protein
MRNMVVHVRVLKRKLNGESRNNNFVLWVLFGECNCLLYFFEQLLFVVIDFCKVECVHFLANFSGHGERFAVLMM